MRAFELSLAADGTRLVAALNGGPQGVEAIYFQWLNAAGAPEGPAYKVTEGPNAAYEADIQLVRGEPVIAWYEKDASGALTAWLARFTAQGKEIWRRALSGAAGSARNPVIRVHDDIINVAWIERGVERTDVWAARLQGDGSAIIAPFRAGEAGENTWNLNAAMDERGVFYVVYDAQLGTEAKELHLLRIENGKAQQTPLSADDGFDSAYPDISINAAGNFGLTWFDARDGNTEIYLLAGALRDLRAGALQSQRLTNTKLPSIGAYLAWNGGRLLVVWCDSEPGQQELFAQEFDSRGRPASAAKQLTHTPLQSSIPAIRPWKTGFALAWNEYLPAARGHDSINRSDAMFRLLH